MLRVALSSDNIFSIELSGRVQSFKLNIGLNGSQDKGEVVKARSQNPYFRSKNRLITLSALTMVVAPTLRQRPRSKLSVQIVCINCVENVLIQTFRHL